MKYFRTGVITCQPEQLPQTSRRLLGSSENSSDVGGFPGNPGGAGLLGGEANVKNRGGFRLHNLQLQLYNFYGLNY